MTTEEYAADLAARFEAMAEKDRMRERDARVGNMPHIAALRSTSAHDWAAAARMVRADLARMSRPLRSEGGVSRPRCPDCDEPFVASGCFAGCAHCDRGVDDVGNRCIFCNGLGEVDDFEPSCECEPDELDFEEAS